MRVSALHIYPLKSARGISLDAMTLDTLGARFDRRWMLIDETGRFISQREEARMALLTASLNAGALSVGTPHHKSFAVPQADLRAARIKASLWDDIIDVIPISAEADAWFSDVLETKCRLVYFPDDSVRVIERPVNPDGRLVGLADGFPLLVISESSLVDLNDRLVARGRDTLPMDRFRPNLVVEDTPAYAEDAWMVIEIAGIRLSIVKPCARCSITTVDQATGIRGKEPLATLATYRRGPDGSVYMSQNAIHDKPGVIRLGDEVAVIAS
jgi:uncharacterized protein YcbX